MKAVACGQVILSDKTGDICMLTIFPVMQYDFVSHTETFTDAQGDSSNIL